MTKKIFLCLQVLILSIVFLSCKKQDGLEIHIIDVGQGDSTLIITPDKKSILIDAGEEENYRSVLREIKSSGIHRIDYVIGTHFDADHIGGLDKVIDAITVNNIIIPPGRKDDKEFYELVNSIKRKSIPVYISKAKDSYEIDNNTKFAILSPISSSEDTNENSVVTFLTYLNYSFIFTGDIDDKIEAKIVSKYKLDNCTFLKVAHHGSKNSSSESFLKEVSPYIATISCGYNNRYGHPHQDTLNRLHSVNTNIYTTSDNGTMVFTFNKIGIYSNKKLKCR